jgi:hypothetical protein
MLVEAPLGQAWIGQPTPEHVSELDDVVEPVLETVPSASVDGGVRGPRRARGLGLGLRSWSGPLRTRRVLAGSGSGTIAGWSRSVCGRGPVEPLFGGSLAFRGLVAAGEHERQRQAAQPPPRTIRSTKAASANAGS